MPAGRLQDVQPDSPTASSEGVLGAVHAGWHMDAHAGLPSSPSASQSTTAVSLVGVHAEQAEAPHNLAEALEATAMEQHIPAVTANAEDKKPLQAMPGLNKDTTVDTARPLAAQEEITTAEVPTPVPSNTEAAAVDRPHPVPVVSKPMVEDKLQPPQPALQTVLVNDAHTAIDDGSHMAPKDAVSPTLLDTGPTHNPANKVLAWLEHTGSPGGNTTAEPVPPYRAPLVPSSSEEILEVVRHSTESGSVF